MNFNSILFLDLETTSQYETYNHLPADWKELWDVKAQFLKRGREEETQEMIYQRAGIYAEFGKVVCISCGVITGRGSDRKLVLTSYCDPDERTLLSDFAQMLNKWSGDSEKFLCAHNGKEFDYPFLCRRMIINGIRLPEILQIAGRKPWEVRHLDTLEMWKFGDYKNFTSLKLMAKVLGIPSPKDDIDGSMVNQVYWMDKDLNRIVEYCQKDVVTLAQVLLRLNCEEVIPAQNITIKNAN